MFGYVNASLKELTKEQRLRYNAVYCGLCRRIRIRAGQVARLSLRYDMTFLALLLMSLYEPEETSGPNACKLHPIEKRPWVDSPIIGYCADMNIALAYYNCLDKWNDDHSHWAKVMAKQLEPALAQIAVQWPRQCAAIQSSIAHLTELENSHCPNPDEPANCFGALMAQLLVYQTDLWAPTLEEMGMHLGRFIYLADAMADFIQDERREVYNPYVVAGIRDRQVQEQHLLMAMGRCTDHFEKLPLVQDKPILDNILYSGVWMKFPKNKKEADQ
ncbi:MAG: hypothetical protein IKY59_02895 [Oscillospiraceae bacterium]|nr:hypothetical protein [Oscillospiraceae bacterium]